MSRNNRTVTNSDVFAGLKVKNQLINDNNGAALEEARLLPIKQIVPNPHQPRQQTNLEKDLELAKDIEQHGILQPIIVRLIGDGQYQIVAGERRWRAAKRIGLDEVPVLIKELDDEETPIVALVENLQRLNLEPIDEAKFFYKMAGDYNISERQIAKMINRSPGYVASRLKLLTGEADSIEETAPAAAEETALSSVRERPKNPAPKVWRYRPQNFQRLREYIDDTIESWEQSGNDDTRELLLQEIVTLKDELMRLEKKLHVKTARRAIGRK